MQRHVLITGVAGFIGAAVAKDLLKRNYKVVGVDNLSTGKLENIPSDVEFIKLDVSSSHLKSLLAAYSFDGILHIAGQSSADVSYSDPIYDLNANVTSTLNLLQIAIEKNIKKFIFASSATVYGEQENPLLLSEEQTVNPVSFYAVGKLASERYLSLYSKEYGINCTSLRLFNVYGPGQNLDNLNQGMASIYLAQALRQKQILVKGSGDRFRDFVYIDDVVQAFVSVLEANVKAKSIINVCTGKGTTVNEVCTFIENKVKLAKPTQFSGSTRGDIHGQTGDPTRLLEGSYVKSLTNFSDGMLKMIEWAQERQIN
ncbi:NAD-dependent epimerase/dehydratase family protein [Idiomarina aquatica]|uniref:NAD-dependent epimerase/dehydratase domain-containing protein n=1 Tax=Idiomarina aquatica TaxID=1327752 RepID=A0AA94EHH1_9GAMM|nr:NAD-dependent epimerase/dehydratase family protein [Idiomarina aquatica]RUO45193.1 hypothetical protein CWE23_04020 [Idiomarina aquatica]